MSTVHASNVSPLPQTPAAVPMSDAVLEAALLGHVLISSMTAADFARLSHLTEDHFYEPRHKRLWGVMKSLSADNLPIDLTTVKSRLKVLTPEGESFLVTIMTQAGNNPIDYARYLQLIEWRRDVELGLRNALSLNANPKFSAEQVASHLNRLATDLQMKASVLIGPASYLESGLAREKRETYATEDISGVGISTGYQDFDAAINGFEKGRVCLFGAASGVGKSILLQNLARRLKRGGQRGLIISFELPVKEYALRAIAMESEIDANTIKQHTMDPDQTRRFNESLLRIEHDPTPLHYVYMDMPTLAQLKSKIIEIYYAGGLDYVCLDYIEARLLTPVEKSHRADPLVFLGSISQMINSLAKELNLFLLIAAQTNRASQQRGGNPELRDFAGGAPLERDAGMAAILQDIEDPLHPEFGATYMHILKSRTSAKRQIVKFKARKNIFTFQDWTPS